MSIDHIQSIIKQKQAILAPGINIVTPESGIDPRTQADWLASLLARMYVEHGITKRIEQLESDIASGACRVWFATRKGQPVASAAQVRQSDGAVEIGRAVSMENGGVGGLLMLLAAHDHLSHSDAPLVAEVRVSNEFLGVPSGEATQKICLDHLELKPHALVPAFNHGAPNRQESFLFSSSQSIDTLSEPIALPPHKNSLNFIASTAIALAANRFHPHSRIQESSNHRPLPGWDTINNVPFGIAVPNPQAHSRLETVVAASEQTRNFTLLPVESTPANTPAITECLNLEFVPLGIDRTLGPNGHPVLLFGRLKRGTLHAPINLVDGLLPQAEKMAVIRIDRATRSFASK
jgi:hypothetical protein